MSLRPCHKPLAGVTLSSVPACLTFLVLGLRRHHPRPRALGSGRSPHSTFGFIRPSHSMKSLKDSVGTKGL